MKKKVIIIVALAVAVAAIAGYVTYRKYLRFTEMFSECPAAAFRAAAKSPAAAMDFVTEESMKSLKVAEKCDIDCKYGNEMACVVHAIAMKKGVFIWAGAEEAAEMLQASCDKKETIACQILEDERAKMAALEKAQAEAEKALANQAAMAAIEEMRAGAKRDIQFGLDHFNGKTDAMKTAPMDKWYNGTISYLLQGQPMLSELHRTPDRQVRETRLEEFVIAKYSTRDRKLKVDQINEFFFELKKLGVDQLELDHRVEKLNERDLPQSHPFFKAKRAFLYRVAETELEILDMAEKQVATN